jgi:predicted Fe-Mo cluster-binding NifX family protein
MYSGTIAIPTSDPDGLRGKRSDHFGHSSYFTLIALDHGQVREVNAIANALHGPGGCQTVVQLLRERQVDTVVAAGMGNGPYLKLTAPGIKVLFADHNRYPDVQSVLDGLQVLLRQPFNETHMCQGSGNCHQHGKEAHHREN